MLKTVKKGEKGITLAALIIYVLVFTMVLGLLASLTTKIYDNMEKMDQLSYSPEEFNKFNLAFVKDVKNNYDAKIVKGNNGNSYNYSIIFSDGTNYNYIYSEKRIYRNKTIIAKNISSFVPQRLVINNKIVLRITITTGRYYYSNVNYGKTLKYVLKYW